MTEATEYTLAQSADGSLNSHSLNCDPLDKRMNYAACQHRQALLAKGDVKTPTDWAGCRTAAAAGTCKALHMRAEEVAAGKAIYMQPRSWLRDQAEKARRWIMPWDKNQPNLDPEPSTTRAHKGATTMLDALGNAGDMAAALTHAVARHGSNPPPAAARPAAPPSPPARPLPGETPLQMARRLAAERAANAAAAA